MWLLASLWACQCQAPEVEPVASSPAALHFRVSQRITATMTTTAPGTPPRSSELDVRYVLAGQRSEGVLRIAEGWVEHNGRVEQLEVVGVYEAGLDADGRATLTPEPASDDAQVQLERLMGWLDIAVGSPGEVVVPSTLQREPTVRLVAAAEGVAKGRVNLAVKTPAGDDGTATATLEGKVWHDTTAPTAMRFVGPLQWHGTLAGTPLGDLDVRLDGQSINVATFRVDGAAPTSSPHFDEAIGP